MSTRLNVLFSVFKLIFAHCSTQTSRSCQNRQFIIRVMRKMVMNEWLCVKAKFSTMWFYWKMVIDLQVQSCIFAPSIREGNFSLYVSSLRPFLKWFLMFGHHNYSCRITVYVVDLVSLSITHPDEYHQLMQGSFSFAKSKCPFSRMALHQVHEQNNITIKD